MLFLFLLLLFQIGATVGYYFITPDNLWMLFLWVPVGLITGWLLLLLSILLVFYTYFALTKPNNKFKHKLVWNFAWFANRVCRLKIEFIGRENIPNDTFVVFGNHKSMMDVFVVYEAMHSVMTAVAKSTLTKVKFIKMFMKVFGVVPLDRNNDRQGVKDLLVAIKSVEEGFSFMIFPEGGIKTRETELIENIKPGAFKLATKPQALVVPVSLIGTSKCAKRTPFKKTKVKCIIHKPITPKEYENLTTQELGEKVVEIINQGVIDGQKN